LVAVPGGEHLGEGGDMAGDCVQVRATRPHLLELDVFVRVEVVGVAQH